MASKDTVVTASKKVSITAASQTLAELWGAALPAGVIAIGVILEDPTRAVRFNLAGEANASTSPRWNPDNSPGVERMPLSPAKVASVEFIRDSAESTDVAAALYLMTAR